MAEKPPTKNKVKEQETKAAKKENSYDGSPLEKKLAFLETCTRCGKRESDQRSLQCDHSFCKNCLSEQKNGNAEAQIVTCFNCNATTELPIGGVEKLLPNIRAVMFKKIIDRMIAQNDDPKNLICDGCGGETVCYCRKCDTNMCESCHKNHESRSLLANHDVYRIDDMKYKLLRQQVAKCEDHNSDIEYMCTEANCLMLLCPICVQFDVCGHEGKIKEIKLLTGNRNVIRKQSIQLKQNIQALEQYYKSAKNAQKEIQRAKKKIEEHHQKVLDDLHKKVEDRKKKLIMELDQAEVENKQRQTELDVQWQQFERRSSQVEQWQQHVDDDTQDDLIAGITMSQLQQQMESVQDQMNSVHKVFIKRRPIKVNFKPKEGDSIGEVKVEEDKNICILPESTDNNLAYMHKEGNSLDQTADETRPDLPSTNSRRPRSDSEHEIFLTFRKAKSSLAGLVDPKHENKQGIDMSARPLDEPILLFEPKKVTNAVFIDDHRLAVSDLNVNIINIYNLADRSDISKNRISSRRLNETVGFAALSMFNNKLLAVNDNLKIFVVNPDSLNYRIALLQDIEECTKVGDMTTMSDEKIFISQIHPHPLILCLNKKFKLMTKWNLMHMEVPSYICSNDQGNLIIVDTENAVITLYDVDEGLVSKRQIDQLIEPRGVCNAHQHIYIVHFDPVSRSDWVLNLDNHVSFVWNNDKIKEYGKALTVAGSEDFFVILAERAIEVYSRRDVLIEDETASIK